MKKYRHTNVYLYFFLFLISIFNPARAAEERKDIEKLSIVPPLMAGLADSSTLTLTHRLDSLATAPAKRTIALTLEKAVAIGLKNNRAIRIAYLQRASQKFDLRVAEDKFSPQFAINSAYLLTHQSSPSTPSLPSSALESRSLELKPALTLSMPTGAQVSLSLANSRTTDSNSPGASSSTLAFSLTQPLLRNAGFEVNKAPVRIARIEERIYLLNLKNAIADSVTQIIFSYRDFLRAQDQLKLSQTGLSRTRRLMDINKALIDAGRMAKIDILQTEADVASQELAVEEAQNQLESTRLALLTLLAMDPETSLVAEDALISKPVLADMTAALATVFENQPEYLSALLSIERAEINLKVAKNQQLWDLSFVAGATSGKSGLPNLDGSSQSRQKSAYAGLQLNIPLTDLTVKQAEVRASTNLNSEKMRLEELRQVVEQRVRNAVRDVQTRWRQFEIAQHARTLSMKKLEAENSKLQAGRSSNFQVLSFESDLRNSENAQLNTMIAYLNALTTLDQQQGTLLHSWNITLND